MKPPTAAPIDAGTKVAVAIAVAHVTPHDAGTAVTLAPPPTPIDAGAKIAKADPPKPPTSIAKPDAGTAKPTAAPEGGDAAEGPAEERSKLVAAENELRQGNEAAAKSAAHEVIDTTETPGLKHRAEAILGIIACRHHDQEGASTELRQTGGKTLWHRNVVKACRENETNLSGE